MSVVDRGQIDPKPLGAIAQAYDGLEWEFKSMHNPKPYLEIHLNGDNLLMHPYTTPTAQLHCTKSAVMVHA